MRVCLQLGRPGRAKMLYLLNEHGRRDSSKASTGRGTREPRQPRVPHSQTSFSPPSPCASTGAASRGRPRGSPCFLLPSRRRCYTHQLLPRPPAWAPCLPGRPFALPPPPYHPPRGSSPSLSAAPVPRRLSAAPHHPHPVSCLSFPSSSPGSRRERRGQLPWASPPLVSTPMAFPVPDRFSKNLGW